MPNVKKVATLSVAVLIAQGLLTKFVYPVIGKTTQQLFSIEPTTGIGGQKVGDTVLGYLTGYIPFDISNFAVWISMFLGVFALLYIGMFMYEQRKVRLWQGKNLTQRLFAILLYGHVALFAILWLMKMGVPGIAVNLLIGLGLNLLLVSAIVVLSANKLKFPRI